MPEEKKENAAAKDTAKNSGEVSKTSDVKKHFDEMGAKSQENLSKGGKVVEVNLVNKTMVEFTSNHGHFKKGDRQEVSDVAFAIYDKKKVIKKL